MSDCKISRKTTEIALLSATLPPLLLSARFVQGRKKAEQQWQASHFSKLRDFGSVRHLSILPLIDWYVGDEDLIGEPGVSYLIRADDTLILFDLGLNRKNEHPSPLLRNMARLGISLDDIDMIFLSHAHPDHVGGMNLLKNGMFSPTAGYANLHQMPAYLPVPLVNPSTTPIVIERPTVLAPGIVSMGPIPRQLFFLGWTPEQTLAIHVEGKGMVLIVGCGHPTLQRILARKDMLFDEPLYGLVGGLHFPVTGSRSQRYGIPAQQLFGTGLWPWQRITKSDVHRAITSLYRHDPKVVALSPHDSCDWSLAAFRTAFGERYRDVLVGKEITF